MHREDERTLRMKQEFMSLKEEGMTIVDIAQKFDLSSSTVRRKLDDIAKANGIKDRKELLDKPHGPHLTYIRQFGPIPEVDITEVEKKFAAIEVAIKEFRGLVEQFIRDQEEVEKRWLEDLRVGH